MFPIRDHNPSSCTPVVTWALIAINVVVFLSYFPALSVSEARIIDFYDTWALIPAEVTRGFDLHTILTSMFLHGGWLHLLGNMLFLFIFGDNLEDQMGPVPYLAFYLLAGLGAAAAQVFANPASPVPMVGASGAIAGVLGGYLLLFPRARVDVLLIIVFLIRIITVPAWIVLGLWFAIQLFSGVATPADAGGVAYWAHAGGFVVGLGLALPLWLRRGGPAFWGRTHGQPPNDAARLSLRRTDVPSAGRRQSRPGLSRRSRPSPWGPRR